MNISREYQGEIKGILSTFDRMIFKVHLTSFFVKRNMNYYLWEKQVLLKNFKSHAISLSEKIMINAKRIAESENRPYEYIPSPKLSKENYAKKIMVKDKVTEGLIRVFRAVEPCKSFTVRGNKLTKN